MNLTQLKAWIDKTIWSREQVTTWAQAHFFRRAHHQQTNSGASSGTLPIITLPTGYIDPSFIQQTAIAEYIADTVGAMVTGNTETGIAVTYQDADNTLDFDAQTAGDARYVALTGDQSIAGNKTFTGNVIANSLLRLTRASATIASGAITATSSYMMVDTESAAATDDLDTINGGVDGALLILRSNNSARDVTLTGAGNIRGTGIPFTLSTNQVRCMLIYDATLSLWVQIP